MEIADSIPIPTRVGMPDLRRGWISWLLSQTPTFCVLDLDLVLGLDVGVVESDPKRPALPSMSHAKQHNPNRIVQVQV